MRLLLQSIVRQPYIRQTNSYETNINNKHFVLHLYIICTIYIRNLELNKNWQRYVIF